MLVLILLWASYGVTTAQPEIMIGAEQTDVYFPMIRGKKVGLLVNAASMVSGENLVDLLIAARIDVRVIFSPEHGFRMNADAGESVGNTIDSLTGIPVISLYGKKKQPNPSDMKDLDVVLFDIQDVGVRFYTYISTLTYMMEACSKADIPIVLLDRPNPNTFYIDGPVLERGFTSFVGLHPVPVVYGMTIGEYARMVNGEGWLEGGKPCRLTVVPMKNFNHERICTPTTKPSPNLGTLNAMLLYPSLCLFEGTDVSVGRGTQFPFEVYGHPEIQNMPFSFTPVPIRGMSLDPPHKGVKCYGEDLRSVFQQKPRYQGKLLLEWLISVYKNLGKPASFFNSYFNLLAGNDLLQRQIKSGVSEKKIRASWRPGLIEFNKVRKKYLLYSDFRPG